MTAKKFFLFLSFISISTFSAEIICGRSNSSMLYTKGDSSKGVRISESGRVRFQRQAFSYIDGAREKIESHLNRTLNDNDQVCLKLNLDYNSVIDAGEIEEALEVETFINQLEENYSIEKADEIIRTLKKTSLLLPL